MKCIGSNSFSEEFDTKSIDGDSFTEAFDTKNIGGGSFLINADIKSIGADSLRYPPYFKVSKGYFRGRGVLPLSEVYNFA